jgi:protein-glutamine gamma-glutamyltransferase
VLLWRARLALRNGAAAQPLVVAAGAGAGGGLTLWTERTLLGKEAGVTCWWC